MCGIVGILKKHESVDTGHSSKQILSKMVSAVGHRGPDAWGTYISPRLALGHTRLSIVDLATGDQPMHTDRHVIVYNGEIYNYIELREELIKKGTRFHTTSDTEVALKCFEAYGYDAFAKFNGQFAMLIWDKSNKTLCIARDRYGIRPLYVLGFNQCIYFSSEMKAFDQIDGYRRSFDMERLFEHALIWNSLDDETVYENIGSLPAGTFEVYSASGCLKTKRYYEIGESSGEPPKDYETAKEEFKSLLNDSVNLRLRSDVPVGVYLSGGIDSSVIAHLTALNKKERFKTFSIGFRDAEFDESKFQDEMIDRIQSDHLRLDVDYADINDNFQNAVNHFERPVFRTAGVPLFLLSQAVRSSGMKVVLTGEGADEVLYGYDSFKELKILRFWSKYPDSKMRPLLIKRLYPHLSHYKNETQFGFLRIYYEEFFKSYENELAGLNIRIHNNLILSKYFNKELDFSFDREKFIHKVKRILPDNYSSWSLLQKNQFWEMKTLLSGYLLSSQGDRMSMAHGVEGRYPFLDHRLVEKLFYYPDSYKLNGFSQKALLCDVFKNNIPEAIIRRPKKPYTAPDLKSFFPNGKLSEQASHFLSAELISDYGIFDPKYVARFVKKFEKRIPAEIGYRDNMLITFILSCQIANDWSRNPKSFRLDEKLRTVDVEDY